MPILEKSFEYRGYKCVVLMTEMGHRCGYVGIPKENSLYNKYYDELNKYIGCHGGLTYSSSELHCVNDKDMWWIGFDCAHIDDRPDFETAKQMFKDNKKVIKSLETIEEVMEETTIYKVGTVKTLDFCEAQCKDIVKQVIILDEVWGKNNEKNN